MHGLLLVLQRLKHLSFLFHSFIFWNYVNEAVVFPSIFPLILLMPAMGRVTSDGFMELL